MRTAGDVRRSARLRDAVGTRLGLQFDEDRADVLAAALARRAAACGESEDRYVARIESDATREEIQALARELTVGETYFFRHVQQLRALSERVLPDLLSARAQVGRLRLLSAGCASGEEAFTLRMMVAEHPAASRWDVDVVGLDVNEASIESARAGQFSAWSLRETPADARERWFRRSGQGFVLDEALRGSVRLEPRNLVDDDPAFWGPGAFDVVFCRNVLMYMTPPAAGAIVGRLVRSLAPGGYLFLGHAETLGASPPMLELCHTHETFYYRRREVDGAITRAIPGSGPAPAVGDDPAAWRVAIERSIAHIDRLDGALRRPADGARPSRPDRPAVDLEPVMTHLKAERFTEALAALEDDSAPDPERLLLRAVVLTQLGEFESAMQACSALHRLDALDAAALFVVALCREAVGDDHAAGEYHRLAARMDPGFAMPRLHLARLSRKSGWAIARPELQRALQLLEQETERHIALFGGGFTRDALVAMVRSELAALRSHP